jgi:hypothetical protein
VSSHKVTQNSGDTAVTDRNLGTPVSIGYATLQLVVPYSLNRHDPSTSNSFLPTSWLQLARETKHNSFQI